MLSKLVILFFVAFGARWVNAINNNAEEWWKDTFIYQVYPRSFKDSNGDGVGDLNGITSKLEHLADLGISAFWISPFYPSPMADSGYDISNFIDVDPIFGNLDDFDRLVAKAKSLGLKVLVDFVPNHSSDEHIWFKKSIQRIAPYTDYYIWKNATIVNGVRQPPNNWLCTFGGSAWEWNDQRGQYYLHQFAIGQPDLNYRNLEVENEMKNVIKFWLARGVYGFRIDAISHMYEDERFLDEPKRDGTNLPASDYDTLDHIYTKNLDETYFMLSKWRSLCDAWIPKGDKKILMTEAYENIELTTKFFKYGSNVPFNFMFMGGLNSRSLPVDFKNSIDAWFNAMPDDQTANWVVGNHDQRRVTERFGVLRADELTMLAAVLPGVGVVYNGDEIGMEDVFLTYEETQDPAGCYAGPDRYYIKSRDPQRTPYQWDDTVSAGFSTNNKTWLRVNSNYKTLNLAAQKRQLPSHYSVFKKLVSLKKYLSIVEGKREAVFVTDNTLGIVRRFNNEVVVLIINVSDSSVIIDAKNWLDIPESLFVYTASVHSNMVTDVSVNTATLNLPGHVSVILSSKNLDF